MLLSWCPSCPLALTVFESPILLSSMFESLPHSAHHPSFSLLLAGTRSNSCISISGITDSKNVYEIHSLHFTFSLIKQCFPYNCDGFKTQLFQFISYFISILIIHNYKKFQGRKRHRERWMEGGGRRGDTFSF